MHKDQEDFLDQMEILESVVLEEYEDQQDHRGQLESPDHQVEEECLDLMVHLDQRVNLVIEVLWVQLVLKVNLVIWVDQDHQGCKDSEGPLEEEVHEEQWALLVKVESLVKMGKMVSLDHRDCKDFQDQWELQVTKGQWENKDSRDILVFQVPRAQEVIQEKMEYQVTLDPQGPPVLLVTEELQEAQDQEDFKECLVPQEKMVCQAEMENLEYRVLQV